jgi:hypothetical protein
MQSIKCGKKEERRIMWDLTSGKVLWTAPEKGHGVTLPGGKRVRLDNDYCDLGMDRDLNYAYSWISFNDEYHDAVWDIDRSKIVMMPPGKGDAITLPDGRSETVYFAAFQGFRGDGVHFLQRITLGSSSRRGEESFIAVWNIKKRGIDSIIPIASHRNDRPAAVGRYSFQKQEAKRDRCGHVPSGTAIDESGGRLIEYVCRAGEEYPVLVDLTTGRDRKVFPSIGSTVTLPNGEKVVLVSRDYSTEVAASDDERWLIQKLCWDRGKGWDRKVTYFLWSFTNGELSRTLPSAEDRIVFPDGSAKTLHGNCPHHYTAITANYAACVTWIGKENYLLLYDLKNNRVKRAVLLDSLAQHLGVNDKDRLSVGEVTALGERGDWALQTVEIDGKTHRLRWDFEGSDPQLMKRMKETLAAMCDKNDRERAALSPGIDSLEKRYAQARSELRRIREAGRQARPSK